MEIKNLKFKRNTDLENSACDEVVTLFLDRWESTSKKSSKKITALVLSQIKDACVTVVSDNETKEHFMLLHANTYFEKWINLLQSRGALPIVIKGKQFEDIIHNLELIKKTAKGEEFEKDIVSRLDHFICLLNSKVAEIYEAAEKEQKKDNYIKLGIIAGVIVFAIALLVALFSDVELSLNIFNVVLTIMIVIGVGGVIVKYMNSGNNGRK